MYKNKRARQLCTVSRETTGSGMNILVWIRHAGFYAILTIAIVFTGCDSTMVDSGTSSTSDIYSEMHQSTEVNGNAGELAPVCEVTLVDISLVLDVSGSMLVHDDGTTRLQAAKDGAKALVDQLSDSDQGALVSFSTFADRNLDLTAMDAGGKTSLENAIDGLTASNRTNIQGGIIFGAEELTGDEALYDFVDTSPSGNNRTDATKIMVILSDGVANAYFDENTGNIIFASPGAAQPAAEDAADAAKAEGIRVFTIAIGEADEAAMAALASSPDDAFTSEDVENLVEVFTDIAEVLCPTAVEIDIKPGSDPNSINPNNNGDIPVAVFTTDDFDATTIDPETVRFGSLSYITSGEGATLAHTGGHLEDVDNDGRPDFVGHFPTQDAGFTSDDEYGWIIGETEGGESIAGKNEVRIVDHGKPSL